MGRSSAGVEEATRGGAAGGSLSVMLEELAARAWEIEVPWDRRGVGGGAAVRVDRLLVRVARGHGAVDVALGECLAAVGAGDRTLRLGFAGLADYAREVLGMAGRTALGLARLSRELGERPLLRAAVRRGEVSARLAQELLPVAKGEAEAGWVARAAQLTVREARAAVRAAAAGQGLPDDDWERIEFPADAACRARVDEAFALAGELLGATAPRWQRLEAICQEYLGANPAPEGAGEASGEGGGGVGGGGDGTGLEELEAALEAETGRWERLLWPEPVAAPEVGEERDVAAIDARVRELAAMRDRWDDLVGHLGLVVQAFGLWRHLGFASFAHYCAERLGMAERTVAQRVWLERRLHDLPGLREAMRQGQGQLREGAAGRRGGGAARRRGVGRRGREVHLRRVAEEGRGRGAGADVCAGEGLGGRAAAGGGALRGGEPRGHEPGGEVDGAGGSASRRCVRTSSRPGRGSWTGA